MQITTIPKKGKCMKYLENQRGIFLTSIVSKVYEKLLKNRVMKYLKNVIPFQAGCRTNGSSADNTFLLRGCIDHAVYIGQPVCLALYDYKQCFDSLMVR